MKITLSSYIQGFIGSVFLTLIAYTAVTDQWLVGSGIVYLIFALALIQLSLQLFFFLHLGKDNDSKSNWLMFLSTMVLVLIVVGGSLWIMKNLDYHTMGHDAETKILESEGIKR